MCGFSHSGLNGDGREREEESAFDRVDWFGALPEARKVGAVVRCCIEYVTCLTLEVVVGKEWAQLGGSGSGCWWSLLW